MSKTDIKILSNREFESLSNEQKKEYIEQLRLHCDGLSKSNKLFIGQKILSAIYPIVRKYDLDIDGEKNLPSNPNSLFVVNHSNSHDILTAYEFLSKLGKDGTIMVATDCLSPFSNTLFKFADATMFDRRDKSQSSKIIYDFSKKMMDGKSGVIFGEATWNIHPVKPMHNIKIGPARSAQITGVPIIPTIMEYVEVPEKCEKDSELFTRCIIRFGKPIYVGPCDDLIAKTYEIHDEMTRLRKELWKSLGIKKENIEDVNQELYLNHTYAKKFEAFGFEYDSEAEQKFLFSPDGKPVENEYTLNENGLFVPGVTKKVKKHH